SDDRPKARHENGRRKTERGDGDKRRRGKPAGAPVAVQAPGDTVAAEAVAPDAPQSVAAPVSSDTGRSESRPDPRPDPRPAPRPDARPETRPESSRRDESDQPNDRRDNRGTDDKRGRGRRDRQRDEQIVGMGDHVPDFMLREFRAKVG
ncbi:MAG: hypothetical protein KJZ59_07700, partial [Pararhodobacter sp.]|nr:hypothetical protein [Pararhodobacter sp.]